MLTNLGFKQPERKSDSGVGQHAESFDLLTLQALARTLWMSGAYAAFENMVVMIYIFGAHVPLFLYGCAPDTFEQSCTQRLPVMSCCSIKVSLSWCCVLRACYKQIVFCRGSEEADLSWKKWSVWLVSCVFPLLRVTPPGTALL